jgi:acetyl-CoA carboxylase carboxyl transferase subunit beta
MTSDCSVCVQIVGTADLARNLNVCPCCGCHHQMDSSARIAMIADSGSFDVSDHDIEPTDPLLFHDRLSYRTRLTDNQLSSGLKDAVVTGFCRVEGMPLALGVMDFRFMAGTIGSVVGEKLTRLVEQATQQELPALIVCASGGGRMQEGIFSLMQIAKVSAALQRHREAGLLYIALLTNPTLGGATASFGMLGDLILAEPKALIGFAGRRVIEQTLRVKLPAHFQTAESLREHGFVDLIVERHSLRRTLVSLLSIHGPGRCAF